MSGLLTLLDRQLSIHVVIWAFPPAFLIHDLEEILTMERFARENRNRFPKALRFLAAITTRQFTIGVAILFIFTVLAAFLGTRPKPDLTLFTICNAIFLLHVFTHVAQPIVFRKYTPGVITAVLVVLPYSLYAFHRLSNGGLISQDDFSTSLLVGLLLIVPVIFGIRQLGKMLARSDSKREHK